MRARRVAFGVAANILDKLVVAAVQLLLVPILATHWGVPVYGAWILMATIPSFLSVSDLGFGTAAGTRMTMLNACGERAETVRVFQSAWATVLVSSTSVLGLVLAIGALVPATTLPSAAGLPAGEARTALLLLMTYGVVSLQGSIFLAGFRCAGLFPLGMFCSTMAILAENCAVIVVVTVLGGGPIEAAAALLGSRLAAIACHALLLRRIVPWLRIGFGEATRGEVRALIAPALAVVAIPLAQAAFLQGTALALGAAVSAAAVPAFTASRTLSRIGLQLTQLLNHAMLPEYSGAVARDDRPAQAAMLVLTLAASGVVIVPFALALALFGPEIVAIWTNGAIVASSSLMIVMAGTVVLGGFWTPVSNLILAMNRHAGYSYPFVILALATMPVAYLLSGWLGATGAALAIVLLDLGMCIVVVRLGRDLFVSQGELRAALGDVAGIAHGMLRRVARR